MPKSKHSDTYQLVALVFLLLLSGFILNFMLSLLLFSISSFGKMSWFVMIDNWINKGLLFPLCALYISFNLAMWGETKCRNKDDEKLILGAFIVGMIIAEFVGIGIFLDTPRYGMVGEILAGLLVGAFFVVVGFIPKILCIGIVKLGLVVSFFYRDSEIRFAPYIASFVLLIVALSLNFYILTALEKEKSHIELNAAKKNTTDSLLAIQAKFQNNENMFKHWIVRPDSVREYSYRIHHKHGYYIDLVKEVNKLGNPICLRRKVFSRDNRQMSEDTITLAKIIPNPAIPGGGITSLVAVNYLFKYDRQEYTRDELVKWCNSVILFAPLVKDDAGNIMAVISQISISDKSEFRLSEDGLHELISRLAIAAQHPS